MPAETVFASAGGRRYHATADCRALLSAQELSDWDYGYEFPPPPGARLPVMRAVLAVDPAQVAVDGKRPCLVCFPAGAMRYLPMPATETFGHEPVIGFTDGRGLGQVCARCSTVDPRGPRFFGTRKQAVRWPCTSAVVLGLTERKATS